MIGCTSLLAELGIRRTQAGRAGSGPVARSPVRGSRTARIALRRPSYAAFPRRRPRHRSRPRRPGAVPPGRAEPCSAPGGPNLRHRSRRPCVRGRCHASVPGGSGRVGPLDILRHLRGSAGSHRPAPSRGSHSGHVRCAGSPERIPRSTRRLSPRFVSRFAAGPSLPPCESPRVPLTWGRRVNLARTRTCGPTRDTFGVLDRRSVSPRKPRRQSLWSVPRGVLPGQCCRVVDRRGAPFVVLGRRARAARSRTCGGHVGHVLGRSSAARDVAHSPVLLTADGAAHASPRFLIAVLWIARVTVAEGAAGRVPVPSCWSYPGRERSSGSPERTTK